MNPFFLILSLFIMLAPLADAAHAAQISRDVENAQVQTLPEAISQPPASDAPAEPAETDEATDAALQTATPPLDTLSQAYAEKWEGAEQASQKGPVWVRILGGNDLMPVVLTVSLIIWSVLLTYLIRLERRLKRMEASASFRPSQAS